MLIAHFGRLSHCEAADRTSAVPSSDLPFFGLLSNFTALEGSEGGQKVSFNVPGVGDVFA
jgi:hypothetical protein